MIRLEFCLGCARGHDNRSLDCVFRPVPLRLYYADRLSFCIAIGAGSHADVGAGDGIASDVICVVADVVDRFF